jgi:putative selenium metabolism protein SsnA
MLRFAGGTLLEPGARRLRRADLVVDGDHIVSVAGSPAPADDARIESIDCTGRLVLPGLALGHTHLYSALALGMPPPSTAPRDFPEILARVWWRLDRALDAESIALSAEVGAIAAARAGITTVVDHHASPGLVDGSLDLVGGALERVGLRGVLCYETSERNGEREARAGLAENDRFLRRVASPASVERPALLRGMVGAHAGFTLGHHTTVELADLARRHDVGVHIHVAEDECDAQHLVPARQATIVEWLDQYRLLGPRSLLAHCVHVDDAGAERIVAAGARVAHNPRSNQNNAVGYARPGRFGAQVVLGTDGIGADLFAEAQAAFFAARAAGHAFDPLAALARAQSLAASAFDLGLGRLEPGCPADLTVLDWDPPTPLDEGNLLGHLVFGMSAATVRDVFVAGRPVLRNRRLVTVDEAEVMARARAAAARLWGRMAELPS